jgi:hypothetical protein
MFNLGVETGQVLFVLAVSLLLAGLRKFQANGTLVLTRAAPYAIGSVAAFWTFKRVGAFLMLTVLVMLAPVPVFADQDTSSSGSETETAEEIPEEEKPEEGEVEKEGQKKPKDPNRGRFLPIPIFITEPAIGEGLGLALTYFHRTKAEPKRKVASPSSIADISKEQAAPPTVTGVFGAYTSNETMAGGIGHMNTFKDDHIRFTGLLALADINSTFYVLDQPFKFNLSGVMLYQETRFRFGDSRWFWGIGLSYLDASATFNLELPNEVPLDLISSELQNSGLSAKLAWDTRDNTSMPNKGQLFDLAVWRYDESIGGDFDYWNAKLKLLSFHPLHEKFVLGLRFEYSTIEGRAPFFAVPWVVLRGIPALRYQGDRVWVAEVEGRYNLSPKWALVAFTGTGAATSDIPIFDTEQDIYAYGAGVRYRIFEAQNIWVGIDIARGPEDTNWYIQIGHAW